MLEITTMKRKPKRKSGNKRNRTQATAKPTTIETVLQQGVSLFNAREFALAEQHYLNTIKLAPDHAHSYFLLGSSRMMQGKVDGAVQAFTDAANRAPEEDTYFNSLALALEAQGKIDDAIKIFLKAIQLNPKSGPTHFNLGNTLFRQGNLPVAANCFANVVALDPGMVDAIYNLGLVYRDMGQFSKAVETLKQAQALMPEKGVFEYSLASCFRMSGDQKQALTHLEMAEVLEPDNAKFIYNQTFPLLALDRVQEGLDAYERRWEVRTKNANLIPREFKQPLWDGTSDLSSKTILVWGEQGVGDILIWASALHLVIARSARCIFECTPKMVSLLQRSFPEAEIIAEDISTDATRTDIDTHIPLASLFHRLRPDLSEGLSPGAFITPNPERVAHWTEHLRELGPGPKVGISWASPHNSRERAPNYTQLSEWEPILKTPGVTFINLQCFNYEDQLAWAKDTLGVPIHNLEDIDLFDDIENIAALAKSLDMVLSVATGIAPIAAAVGTTVWQLTWRQSPWSNFLLSPRGPDVTYFYRDTLEPWDNAITAIAEQLADFK